MDAALRPVRPSNTSRVTVVRIETRRAEYQDVEPMRGLYRQEFDCQIIHDSILARGMADPVSSWSEDGWPGTAVSGTGSTSAA